MSNANSGEAAFLDRVRKILNKTEMPEFAASWREAVTNDEQDAVLCILSVNWNECVDSGFAVRWVSQEEIAGHPEWWSASGISQPACPSQSDLRRVRAAVRRLRILRGVPIISSKNGYAIVTSEKMAVEFLRGMERTAKARAAASMRTYKAMKHALNLSPELAKA